MMHLHCEYKKYKLQFKFDAGTSRGVLKDKHTYFLRIYNPQEPASFGLGECGPLPGLSPDDRPELEKELSAVATRIAGAGLPDVQSLNKWLEACVDPAWPAIRFGVETAVLDYLHGGQRQIVDNPWSTPPYQPVPINGLVWMGSKEFMLRQIDEKLKAGYNCIKLKIGALDFSAELDLLAYIRRHYDRQTVTLRVDANGAFSPEEAADKLQALAEYHVHSIEQPVKAGQRTVMRELCRHTPVPIALDEELIGISGYQEKKKLLSSVQPQYIILKPTLVGGLSSSMEWILLAEELGIGWWITSALESNIGLNAIAQFTASLPIRIPQGLGTGQLYHNNLTSPLFIENGMLKYSAHQAWELNY